MGLFLVSLFNLIADIFLAQCNGNGLTYQVIDEVTNQKSAGDVLKGEISFIQYKYGQHKHKTTKVWKP